MWRPPVGAQDSVNLVSSLLDLCRAGFAFLVNYVMVSDKDGW